jgi:tRNA-specific 2-thiouridylase
MLTQEQLAHIQFPLGSMRKSDVRTLASEKGFTNAKKHDSQDICFVPDGDYVSFIEQYTGTKSQSGDFLDTNGNVLGHHRGAIGYTIGQRKGLGLACGKPVYVCSKSMSDNTVTVGDEDKLFSKVLYANDLNWIAFDALTEPIHVWAKSRYRQKEQPVTVYPLSDGRVKAEFDEPQRALTVGQAIVFYDGDTVLGGGTIVNVPSL